MIAFGLFPALLILGAPIAVALALAAFAAIALGGDTILFRSLAQQYVAGIESYGLLALPLFILLGEAMNAGGSGRRLMALAGALAGRLHGGLGHVTLLANVMLAAILGSTVAQLTLMTRLAVPEMERAGWPRAEAVAITAAGSLLAPVIPPSMLFILFGVVAQVPVGDLFLAGLLPGALLGLAFFVLISLKARRLPPPSDATAPPSGAALLHAIPALSIPLLVVGSIAGGIATPTEAGGLAALLALAIGLFLHREIALRDLPAIFTRAALSSAMVLFLIASAQLVAWVLAYADIPAATAALVSRGIASPLIFLIVLNLALLALGMVMDPIPALLLTVPVLLPLGTGQYGLEPVHLGLIVCMNLSIGLLTPPVGAGLFAAASLSQEPAGQIAVRLLPFLGVAFAVLLAVSVWPLL